MLGDNKEMALQKKIEAKRKQMYKPDLIHVMYFNLNVLVGTMGLYFCLMDIIKTFEVLSMIALPLYIILLVLFTKPTINLNKEYFE